ncbi:MAG: N-6 DNA methylase [Planctomycetia bacterium]|nr:N-6 DNA methylase [Planctomycetia bacterium]
MKKFQQKYIENTERTYRQNFGQFFTPEYVADFMTRWVLEKNSEEPSAELFDPAFGLGMFAFAAQKRSPAPSVSGIEIDSRILEMGRNFFQNTVFLRHADYFQVWNEVHSRIVCNPPYMRFQKFTHREEVLRSFQEHLGVRFSGYTNIALAFLVKSIFELAPGGRLAYILPLDFLNSGYGTKIKEYLLKQGTIHALLKLDCESDVFPEVTTTVGILLYEKTVTGQPTQFYVVRRLEKLELPLKEIVPATVVPRERLLPAQKWTPFFEEERVVSDSLSRLVPMRVFGQFRRGIATGANRFFNLRASDVQRLGLRPDEVWPCVTKSMQIRKCVFYEEDFEKLVEKDVPVFLLNAHESLSPAMKRYLQTGEKQGVHKRFLTRNRRVWYANENKPPAPLLLGVFSRLGYRVIRNYTQTRNLTCYHGFYPNEGMEGYVDALFLYLLSQAGRRVVMRNKRTYGNGLDKFEPGDLNQSLAPEPAFLDTLSAEFLSSEVAHVAKEGNLSPEGERVFEAFLA